MFFNEIILINRFKAPEMLAKIRSVHVTFEGEGREYTREIGVVSARTFVSKTINISMVISVTFNWAAIYGCPFF